MEEHQEGGFILMDAHGRIRPTRQLLRSSLAICKLSRDTAMRFFTTKLKVFRHSPLLLSYGAVYIRLDDQLEVYVDHDFDEITQLSDPLAAPLFTTRGPWNLPMQHMTAVLPDDLRHKLLHIREIGTGELQRGGGAGVLRRRYHPQRGEARFHLYLSMLMSRGRDNALNFPGYLTYRFVLLPDERPHHQFIVDLSHMSAVKLRREPEDLCFTFELFPET